VTLVEKYGLDAVRYFLLREVPFGSDGVFSNEALINRINSDLANDLGNLVSRTVAMIDKYFGGVLPSQKDTGEYDEDLINVVIQTSSKVEELMDKLQFSLALAEIWKAIARTNKYIDETMPWVLAKDESKKARLAAVLYNLAESIRIISILIQPFMPETPEKIWKQLGILQNCDLTWDSSKRWGVYPENAVVEKGEVIFPRIDLEKELMHLEEITEANKAANSAAASKTSEKVSETGIITIDQFAKIDLRVAKVVEAEKVEGADKLLRLKLQIGDEIRQVVSGIAKWYSPEELTGRNLILVANLKPVKIRGIESQGMILAASEDNNLSLLTVDKDIKSGTKIS